MNDSPEDPPPYRKSDILFQSVYGRLPKFVLYFFLPLLLLVAGGLLVRAIGYNLGIVFKGVKISPAGLAYGVCPVIFLVCAIVVATEVYRRLRPQRIVITENGLFLPKERFTNTVIHIRWVDLKATLTAGGISVIDVYDVACIDSTHKTKVTISSTLFRSFDDFATFALIIGEFIGEDWSIKGFLPGAVRGNKKQAQRVSQRIEFRDND